MVFHSGLAAYDSISNHRDRVDGSNPDARYGAVKASSWDGSLAYRQGWRGPDAP
jgi:hypothetical protein